MQSLPPSTTRLRRLPSACWATLRGAVRELVPDPIHDNPEVHAWRADEPTDYCFRCGASAGPGSVTVRGCAFCRGDRPAWDRMTRLSLYAPPMDGWIKALKFARRWRWGPWLGDRLADRLAEPFDDERVAVCPVPMHWARRWRRGYNQAALIAEALAKRRGWPMVELLRRTRLTAPQTAMAVSARAANVRASFALHDVDLAGWEVVLVDDVKTTGATLTQCARLLRKGGARSVQVAVAAVADPHGQGFRTLRV